MALITLIAAMAENRCIGVDNQMPWHIPEDFKHFKALTMGKPCIMGRKTFESILESLGKPLPGRTNIVVSRSGFEHEGAQSFGSLEEAITAAKDLTDEEICIIGGAQIYAQALPLANRLDLTYVHRTVKGDAFFPEFDTSAWQETSRDDHDGFSFVRLERKAAQ